LLQTYVWQDYDLFPNFPARQDFLAFWHQKLEGPLFAVTVAQPNRSSLPNYAPWTESSGCIDLLSLRQLGSGFFVLKKLKILHMKQAHRSAPLSRQRFDHPHPHPQKTTLTVRPLAASVRTEASVTSGAQKAKLANLTSK
jgi:hypothetical protein